MLNSSVSEFEQAWLDDFNAEWLLICQACLIKVPKDHRGGHYCEYCDATRQLVALGAHLGIPGEHDTLLRNVRSLGYEDYRMGW